MSRNALYEVAYEEAARILSEQQLVIDGFRSRAGLLFSAAAVATSFFATQALRGDGPGLIAWLALGSFVGVAAALLAILWPRRWDSAVNPHDVIGTYIESANPASIEELHRELSFHMYESYSGNHAGLRKLVVYFQIANVLLALELVLWVIGIAIAF